MVGGLVTAADSEAVAAGRLLVVVALGFRVLLTALVFVGALEIEVVVADGLLFSCFLIHPANEDILV